MPSGGDVDASMAPPSRFSSSALAGAGSVTDAVGVNRDGKAPLVLVVALEAGGLASFSSGQPDGALKPGSTALAGHRVTGLAAARLDGSGKQKVIALTDQKMVYALEPTDLRVLWSVDVHDLSAAGAVVAGDQDGDGDDDVAAFSDDYTQLINIETTAASPITRDKIALPQGIVGAAAGDLGGNRNDEFLFMGDGLVEAVSIGNFNYIDDRYLSPGSHERAVFADLDGDGKGDVAVSTPDEVELWSGDGKAGITLSAAGAVGAAAVRDLAILRGKDAGAALVVVTTDGALRVVHGAAMTAGTDEFSATDKALRITTGDVNGDGVVEAVVVARDGTVYTWRDPR